MRCVWVCEGLVGDGSEGPSEGLGVRTPLLYGHLLLARGEWSGLPAVTGCAARVSSVLSFDTQARV